jgi:arrestin-related trafficking adapter 3/6
MSPTAANVPGDSPTDSIDPSDPVATLARPRAAHVRDADSTASRPIHLIRSPSFGPPAFDDDEPPPPVATPPPKYETLVQGDPRNGLIDYFQRLSDAQGDDDDDVLTVARRIDIPLTPGGRINRSMDIQRSWAPVGAR